MSFVEIACFHIESSLCESSGNPFLTEAPHDSPTAELRAEVAHGLRVLGKASKGTFYLLQDLEDPSSFSYIGKWRSKEAYEKFSQSAERAEVVKALQICNAVMDWKSLYTVESLHNWETSVMSHLVHKLQATMKAEVVGIGRNNVAWEDVDKFEDVLSKGRVEMERYSGYRNVIGQEIPVDTDVSTSSESSGVRTENDRKEFVMLRGWASLEQYNDFRSSDKYLEYGQIREWTKWFERRVAKPVPLE